MDVIATRRFELDQDSMPTWVIISIGRPYRADELTDEWRANVQVVFPDRVMNRTVFGSDSFQALILACKQGKLEIESLQVAFGERITWQGETSLW